MKISELVQQLEAVKIEFGDIDVGTTNLERRTLFIRPVNSVYVQHGVAWVSNLKFEELGDW